MTCRDAHFYFYSPAFPRPPPIFETWPHPRAQPALDLWLLPHLLSTGFAAMSYRAAFTWGLRLTQALLHAREAFCQPSCIPRYATTFKGQAVGCLGQCLPATRFYTLGLWVPGALLGHEKSWWLEQHVQI